MNRRKITALLLVLVLAFGAFTISALADAGSFSGSSDYGGGGSDWGGSSDWGSSWDNDYDYDYGSSYYYGGSSRDDGGGGGGSWGVAIVIVIIILVIGTKLFFKSGSGGGQAGVPVQNQPPANLRPISELKRQDPGFSEDAIKEKISNLYVRMQNAWQDKDFEPMRPYMTDALYSQFDRQLQDIIRAETTNYVERISVLGVTLEGWTEDAAHQTLSALVNTRIVDYTVDDNTGKVMSGSKTAEKFMCYRWSLIRSAGVTTPEAGKDGEDASTLNCPNCGAPLDVNHTARCPYCDSIITSNEYDWSISAIAGISQRTGK